MCGGRGKGIVAKGMRKGTVKKTRCGGVRRGDCGQMGSGRGSREGDCGERDV